MQKVKRALLSVSDKRDLAGFARGLSAAGVEIISTGGTARSLQAEGIPVTELSAFTGFPEVLEGRVKTLHPKVHGGLLFRRNDPEHCRTAQEQGFQPIDLVVVNLYPFEQTVSRPGVTLESALDNIDIGGPSMLRSAAKNHESVTVVVDPSDYPEVLGQIQEKGGTTIELRRQLAAKAFARTADYDQAISRHLSEWFGPGAGGAAAGAGATSPAFFPATFQITLPKAQALRYGENPHQRAALYGAFPEFFEQLHGKELSYNNILDLTAAADLVAEFPGASPTLAILKHTNPCGVGQGQTLSQAWEKAYATDQQAPFGGVIAVNTTLDLECARRISGIFSEVIVAPAFQSEALELLRGKKNLRLIRLKKPTRSRGELEWRGVGAGSFLAQEADLESVRAEDLKAVSRRPPSAGELEAMLFGWRVVKHVKSNAIVYAGPDRTLAIGAGQMSRVDSSRLAVWKAQEAGLRLDGSVICSDAFFPFPDALVAAAEAGATGAIQPGGSVRDAEVIAAADQRNLAMVFTGIRHFRH